MKIGKKLIRSPKKGDWCRKWPPPSGKVVRWVYGYNGWGDGSEILETGRMVGVWDRKAREVMIIPERQKRHTVLSWDGNKARWWRTK